MISAIVIFRLRRNNDDIRGSFHLAIPDKKLVSLLFAPLKNLAYGNPPRTAIQTQAGLIWLLTFICSTSTLVILLSSRHISCGDVWCNYVVLEMSIISFRFLPYLTSLRRSRCILGCWIFKTKGLSHVLQGKFPRLHSRYIILRLCSRWGSPVNVSIDKEKW